MAELPPFSQRVKAALKAANIAPAEAAARCGVTPQAVYNILNPPKGRVVKSCNFVESLAKVLSVSPGWLQYGEGSAEVPGAPGPVDTLSLTGLSTIKVLTLTTLEQLMRSEKLSDGEALDLLTGLRQKVP